MLSTRPGWLGKIEIVEVRFDPKRVDYAALVRHAAAKRCASPVFTSGAKQAAIARSIVGKGARKVEGKVRDVEDRKYYLSRTPLRFLPMTAAQAARLNASRGKRLDVLAPSQRRLLKSIEKHPDAGWKSAIDVPFEKSWSAAKALEARIQSRARRSF